MGEHDWTDTARELLVALDGDALTEDVSALAALVEHAASMDPAERVEWAQGVEASACVHAGLDAWIDDSAEDATCARPGCTVEVDIETDGVYCGNNCEIEHLTDQLDEAREQLRGGWTVVGIYTDNDQPWAGHYNVATFEAAEAAARADRAEDGLELTIAGCVRGSHAVWGGDNEHGTV